MKPARNDPCNCGSGKRFKHCCEGTVASLPQAPSPAEINPLIALYNAGRYAELENLARALVGQYPGFGFGWKLLGGALQMQGKNALPAFQKAAELMPGEADAHYNLGVALKSSGLLADAAASYRRALKIKPDYAEAHSNLGTVLYELGQLDDTLASFRRALELKPGSAGSHYNLGKILSELGQLDEAVACYRKAIEIKPDFAMAYYNLGNAMKDLGKFDDAVASYRRSLEINPGFAEAYVNLGVSLLRQDRFAGAETCFRRALEIKPDLADAHSNLGHALKHLGHFNDAMTSYRRAIEIQPNCIEAALGAGLLCMENGEMAEAESLFQKVATTIDRDLNTRDLNARELEARYLLAQVKKVKAGDENFAELVAMEEAARNNESQLPDKDATSLHFALGKCFDDIGDHVLAFQHYIKGCELKRATIAYDAEQTTQYFNSIMQFFDLATIERLRGGGDPSLTPVFVLGMPRSGTTLTEQIIASHPEVHGAGELFDLQLIAQRDITGTGALFPHNIPALDRAGLAAWGADYVAGLHRRAPDAKRITNKMPGNFEVIGLIHVMLPNAKIIHVSRNPVDTCLSCYTQLFNDKHAYTYDLAELGRCYADYARLMAHWRSVLPAGAFLDVQYEDIVADQETQARRMIEFCGLDWDNACIDFHKNERSIRTASVTQVRQPIYNSSVERWRRYEKHLGPLLDALGDWAPKRN